MTSSIQMKVTLRLASFATALGVSLAFAACSESPDAKLGPNPDDGTKVPTADGGVEDSGPEVVVEAGEAGPPRVCSDQNFCHTTLPPALTLRGGWSDANGIAWAISSEGTILRWDGTTWAVHATGLGSLVSIWGSGPTDIWVGSSTALYHGQGASSSALTFTAVAALPGDATPITAIWGTGPDDIWATGPGDASSGYHGRVLHYTGAASGWTLDAASSEPIQYARVWGSTTSGLWLVGVRDAKGLPELAVRRRPAGSADFADVALPGDPNYLPNNPYAKLNAVFALSGSSDDTMWIVGEQGFGKPGFVRGTTADGGQTYTWAYTVLEAKKDFLPNAVWGISANDAWLGGDFGRLRHWDGTTWKQAFITITELPVVDPFYGIWGGGGADLWIVGAGIAMHRGP